MSSSRTLHILYSLTYEYLSGYWCVSFANETNKIFTKGLKIKSYKLVISRALIEIL